jgi:hypothetical protein
VSAFRRTSYYKGIASLNGFRVQRLAKDGLAFFIAEVGFAVCRKAVDRYAASRFDHFLDLVSQQCVSANKRDSTF